jgi:hypothetical protein
MGEKRSSGTGRTVRADWNVPESSTTNGNALTADSAKAATTTAPATDASAGRFVFGSPDTVDSVLAAAAFTMTDAANETASAAVWGWQQTTGGTWLPRLLCVLTVTAGSRTGVSGGDVADTDYLADTIVATVDNTDRAVVIEDSTDGFTVAIFDHMGSDLIEMECTISGGTAASVRPMIRGL